MVRKFPSNWKESLSSFRYHKLKSRGETCLKGIFSLLILYLHLYKKEMLLYWMHIFIYISWNTIECPLNYTIHTKWYKHYELDKKLWVSLKSNVARSRTSIPSLQTVLPIHKTHRFTLKPVYIFNIHDFYNPPVVYQG